MERSTVHDLLEHLASTPAPPSTVDIHGAAVRGRRTVVRRRFAGAASAAVAILAVITIVLANLGPGRPTSITPATPTTQATDPTVHAMPTSAPAAFDPLVAYAAFGFLPDGNLDTTITTAADWQQLSAGYPMTEKDSANVDVWLVAADHGLEAEGHFDYAVATGAMRAGEPADAINGRRAEWITIYGSPALRWEYAPGAWAAVSVRNVVGVDPRAAARAVATSLLYGVGTGVRLPFRTTGIPASLHPGVIQVRQTGRADSWTVQAMYGETGGPYVDWPLVIFAVASNRETGDNSVIGDPTTTVDGHPARRSSMLDGGTGLQLFNVNGVYLELATHSAATTGKLSGGLDGLFRSLQVNPDPATWS